MQEAVNENYYEMKAKISSQGSIKDIVNNTSNKEAIEVYLYGNIELMIMKYCLVKKLVNKDKL